MDGYRFGKSIRNKTLRGVLPNFGNITVGFKASRGRSQKYLKHDILGEVAYLNMWSVEILQPAVLAMSAGGMNVNGNIMTWRDVQYYFIGNLNIHKGFPARFPGSILHVILHFDSNAHDHT